MKIAVIGAGGKVGRIFTEEAVKRGHEVTAFVRSPKNTEAQDEVLIDAEDIQSKDLAGYDVVVNAFGAWTEDTLSKHDLVTQVLCDALSKTESKLYIVGSAGSLYMDEAHTQTLWQSELMPDMYKPLASNMAIAYDNLRKRDDVNWVYVSPALDFRADGEKTGNYQIAGDKFTTNDEGESYISYIDYAIALADIVEEDNFQQERISLLSN